jgi:hypothetical protein
LPFRHFPRRFSALSQFVAAIALIRVVPRGRFAREKHSWIASQSCGLTSLVEALVVLSHNVIPARLSRVAEASDRPNQPAKVSATSPYGDDDPSELAAHTRRVRRTFCDGSRSMRARRACWHAKKLQRRRVGDGPTPFG